MKFNLHALARSNPEFDIQGKLDPLSVDLGLQGALSATIGAISGTVSEIPIRVRIPFLKHGDRKVASVGGFTVHLRPFDIAVKNASIHAKGTLGTDGIRGVAHASVKCQTEVDSKGTFVGKAGNVKLDFTEETGSEV
jgi:hypothetical protein